jgi:hypothetical protein
MCGRRALSFAVAAGVTALLTAACSGRSNSTQPTPAAQASRGVPMAMASGTSSADYLTTMWADGGISWAQADPDGSHWPQSVPQSPLLPSGQFVCGELAVEHLMGAEPGVPHLPSAFPHDRAVAIAARWCGRFAGTGNLWDVVQHTMAEAAVGT